jgi:hypothetical protein
MQVLLSLYVTQQQLTPSELGARLFVTRGNMTGLIEGRPGWTRAACAPPQRPPRPTAVCPLQR